MHKLLTALSLALLITTPALAIDIDNNKLFPAVAQGHSCTGTHDISGQLSMQEYTQINGLNSQPLDFCSEDIQGHAKCDDGVCTITSKKNNVLTLDERLVDFNEHHGSTKSWPRTINNQLSFTGGSYKIDSLKYQDKNITFNTTGKVSIFINDDIALQGATFTINGDVNFIVSDNVVLDDKSKLILTGKSQFVVKGEFKLKDNSVVESADVLKIYTKGNIEIENSNLKLALLGQAYLYSFKQIQVEKKSNLQAYLYSAGDISLQDTTIIEGRVTAKKLHMQDSSKINDSVHTSLPPKRQCTEDNFERADLGSKWTPSFSKGNYLPSIVRTNDEGEISSSGKHNRFRITQPQNSLATAVSFNTIFPGNNNQFVIEFDHFAYIPKSANDKEAHGADGIAIVLSDADINVYPGAPGGPLGYGYSGQFPGFSGGWLGIGIDEHGNFATTGGTVNRKDKVRDAVTIRGAGNGFKGYNFLDRYQSPDKEKYYGESKRNRDWLWSPYYSKPRAHRYRITVDIRTNNSAFVTVERNVEPEKNPDNFESIFTKFDAGKDHPVPENILLSLTGSTGALKNVHEIDNVEICADLSTDIDAGIDHFRFDIKSSNLQSCGAEKVTLTACADSAANCKQYAGPVSVVLASQPSMKWSNGNNITFTGTTDLYLESSAQEVVLDIESSIPRRVQFNKPLCKVGSSKYSEGLCTINFSAEGKELKFIVPDAYSGQKIIGVLAPQEKCQALYAGLTKPINFKAEIIKPLVAVAPPLTIYYKNKSYVADGTDKNLIPISFNSNGTAEVELNYPEAGVTLIKVFDSKKEIEGAARLVTVPKCLKIKTESRCKQANHECTPFKAAGEAFDLTVSAYGSDETGKNCVMGEGGLLKNYQQQVKLSHELIAPIGGEEGALKIKDYLHQPTSSGDNVIIQTLSEVGVFNVIATPLGAFEGSKLITDPGISSPIGRFYPAKFLLDSGHVLSKKENGDKQESYLGQDFNASFSISAVNTEGETVQNYIAGFDRAKVTLDGLVDNENKNVRLSNWNAKVISNWVNGTFNFNAITNFSRIEKQSPFWLDIKLSLDDGEQPNLSKLQDIRTENKDVGCDRVKGCNNVLLGKQQLRYGRLLAPTLQFASNEPATVPLQVQYWDSSKNEWLKFEKDNWTPLSIGNITFTPDKFTNGKKSTLDASTMNNGEIKLNVDAPGEAVEIKYEIDLGAQPWLYFEKSNQGKIIFGTSKGNSSVIYRREQFLEN